MDHVFKPRVHDHKLEPLVRDCGGEGNAITEIINSVGDVLDGIDGPAKELTRMINDHTVTIRGAMINGVFKISTAFINPEPGGMIPWGEAPDGWTCCWAQTGPDPDNWDVVFADPELRGYAYPWGTSFSSFLIKYAKPGDFFGMPFGITPRQRPVSFTPYRR